MPLAQTALLSHRRRAHKGQTVARRLLLAAPLLLSMSPAQAGPAQATSGDALNALLPQSLSLKSDNAIDTRAGHTNNRVNSQWQLQLGINTPLSLKSPELQDAQRRPWLRAQAQFPQHHLADQRAASTPAAALADNQQLDLRLREHSERRFLGGNINPELGGRIKLDGSSQELYLGARWKLSPDSPLSLSLGVAALRDRQRYQELQPNSRDDQNTLLRLPIEASYRFNDGHSASLRFDRLTTDPLAPQHSSEDQLELRYGIRY